MIASSANLHNNMPVRSGGAPLEQAQAGMILLHGRGATAEDILSLAPELNLNTTVFLAPQAAQFTWYPQRFSAPLENNEPWLSSALQVIDRLFQQLNSAGIPAESTILLGFSQGACLALEYAARYPRRYGGIAGLSGALIGPPGIERISSGDLEQTPVFMGCSDVDPHIPLERVEYSARFFERLQARVAMRIYPGMGHQVNKDEIQAVREMAHALDS
jgi:predicted esterase